MDFDTIIIRFGEMSTKGKNKINFINSLAHTIDSHINKYKDYYTLRIRHDHIYIDLNKMNLDLSDILKDIAGIRSFSLALKVDAEIENLTEICLNQISKESGTMFKVKTKRIDKSYPYISDEINRIIAKKILEKTNLKVDVHHPDILLSIEIRDDFAYVFTNTILALGGYPKGTLGRGLMMLSGGIDSPVATHLLIKRGVEVQCIHFSSPPYTNSGVILKLEDILLKLSKYQNKIKLYIIPFTKIQEKIYEISPIGYPITIMRRMMYRLATMLADKFHIPVIASGESLGQVASQTLDSLETINEVTTKPIIRPLATFDKLEIIKIAKEIETYEISIRPFEDCCTIFSPIKPKTSPKIDECKKIEEKFDFNDLLVDAINNLKLEIIKDGNIIKK